MPDSPWIPCGHACVCRNGGVKCWDMQTNTSTLRKATPRIKTRGANPPIHWKSLLSSHSQESPASTQTFRLPPSFECRSTSYFVSPFAGPNELPSCRLAMEKQRAPARATQMEMDRKGKDWMCEAVEADEKNPLIWNVRLRFEASQSNPASTPQSTWHNLGSKRTCGNNL